MGPTDIPQPDFITYFNADGTVREIKTAVPSYPVTLGKDALCSYCGGALWVCRGVHNIC